MDRTENRLDEIALNYTDVLRQWLQGGGESVLEHAYEIGRSCLSEGRSILDMIWIHHEALQAMEREDGLSFLGQEKLKMAGRFFVESMSPFEMTHRSFGEGNRAIRRLNETLEDQSRLIARQLHDQAGQLLAAAQIDLEMIRSELPADFAPRFKNVQMLLDQVGKEFRRFSHELRPTILEDLGLVAALEHLVSDMEKRTGVRIAMKVSDRRRLPARIEVAFYRIVQEALNNIIRHSHATAVEIQIQEFSGYVTCSVSDNGIGFEPSALDNGEGSGGLGLLGIRERLRALQGEFRIESVLGCGTQMKVSVPIEG